MVEEMLVVDEIGEESCEWRSLVIALGNFEETLVRVVAIFELFEEFCVMEFVGGGFCGLKKEHAKKSETF